MGPKIWRLHNPIYDIGKPVDKEANDRNSNRQTSSLKREAKLNLARVISPLCPGVDSTGPLFLPL